MAFKVTVFEKDGDLQCSVAYYMGGVELNGVPLFETNTQNDPELPPPTGDNLGFVLGVVIVCVVLMIIVIVKRRKKEDE